MPEEMQRAYEHVDPENNGKMLVEIKGNSDLLFSVDNRNIKVRVRHNMTMEDFDELYDEIHRHQRDRHL